MYLDTSYNYEYILTLCKPNKEPIQEMFDIFDFTFEAKFPTTDEISFRVSKKLDERDNKLWDLIKGDYLIHIKIINDKDSLNEKYFIINNIKENADDKTIKTITAYSLESELNKKIIRQYNLLSRQLYSPTNAYDSDGFQVGILNYIETLTSWSIDLADIESSLLNKFRAFDVSQISILDFLVNTVQHSFGCIFEFDTVNRKISAKSIDNVGQDKGFYISEDNLIKSVNREINHDEVVTRLYVYGKDDISIRQVNPTGQPFVENFNFYKNEDYMSSELISALDDYEILTTTLSGQFEDLLEQQSLKQQKINQKEVDLLNINVELVSILDSIDVAIKSGQPYSSLNTNKINKQNEMNVAQSQLETLNDEIDTINNNISLLKSQLQKENNFTVDQIKELDFFIRERVWSDENYETPQDLWDEIPNIFQKINQPPITFEQDIVDFTQILQFQKIWNKLILGDLVYSQSSKLGFDYTVRLVGYTHKPEDRSLKLQFSNQNSIDDPNIYMTDLIKNAITAGITVDMSKYKWDKAEENSTQVSQILTNAWDASKNAVLAGSNQDIIINDRGIALSDITNPNEQLRIINNVIAMTEDGWNTASLAITPTAIYADKLFGNLIASNSAYIETPNGDFTVNSSGVRIENLDLEVVRKNNLNQDVNRILLNADEGLRIQQYTGSTWVNKFYADENGNLTLTGNINITSGEINLGNGNFVVTTDGTTTIKKGSLSIGGTITTPNFNVDTLGNLTARSANVKGAIDCTSLSINGTSILSGSKINSQHITNLSANQITVSGDSNFASGYDPSTKETPSGSQSKVNALSNSLGGLAWGDVVEKAQLGTTVIQGGYIRTNLIDVDDLRVRTIWDANGEANLQLAQGGTIPTLVLSDENGVKRAGIQGNSSGAGFSAGLSGYPIMWLYNNYLGSPSVNFSNATNVYCNGTRLLKEGEAGGTVTAVFG